MSSHKSLLLIDPSEDSREVIKLALASEDTEILEAANPRDGLQLARRWKPDVIVLDVENDEEDCLSEANRQAVQGIAENRESPASSVVVLATARYQASTIPGSQFVAKPYHYGPLIRKIESLLQQGPDAASLLVAGSDSPPVDPSRLGLAKSA